MKLISVNANPNLTSLQGYIECSYNELCKLFGRPFKYEGDKVTTEWNLTIRDDDDISHTIIIYDWKEAKPPRGIYNWHIGGHNKAAARVLHDFSEQENLKETAWLDKHTY